MNATAASVAPAGAYLLDTKILVYYVRGSAIGSRIEAAYRLLSGSVSPLISIVTEGEIRSLALQFAWGKARLKQIEHLISAFTPIPLNAAGLIQAYADLDAYSRTVGRRMGKNDLWIAATARVTGAKLLTADADFDHLTPAFLDRDLIP